ncbi:hypothetical protein [Bradyrhizobium zhanjiangense]|uniref:hypothetical protein n=1 Tax=Bradyrhizobium zhanjiangense TaxID=1325107 RepID=UPI001FE13033|nr:hypothetical protein [Bradyrhizobium zhanjiangense]
MAITDDLCADFILQLSGLGFDLSGVRQNFLIEPRDGFVPREQSLEISRINVGIRQIADNQVTI